jgi:hypothetical protein
MYKYKYNVYIGLANYKLTIQALLMVYLKLLFIMNIKRPNIILERYLLIMQFYSSFRNYLISYLLHGVGYSLKSW